MWHLTELDNSLFSLVMVFSEVEVDIELDGVSHGLNTNNAKSTEAIFQAKIGKRNTFKLSPNLVYIFANEF